MKTSMKEKLDALAQRLEEIGALLGQPDVINDSAQFRDLSKEYAQLEPIVACFKRYLTAEQAHSDATALLSDDDADMRAMAQAEIQEIDTTLLQLEAALQQHLLPRDPDDECNIFLEIRAGTGGDEAALFAGDLFRMYSRYAETLNWRVEIMAQHQGEHGGYKEIIARVSGNAVYSRLKFESGAHRVQRVPVTESQGRIHTSACTVAVLPEIEVAADVEINSADLRIDTYRSSGAGGQHVNTTDSAIRITHLPTGIVVECQDERSQHKNKARALSVLHAKIIAQEKEQQRAKRAQTRRDLVGSGDRSERIRTYNFPQGRVTDHRINLTLYKLEQIMVGQLDEIIDPLIQENQADLLAEGEGEA